jgi:hypothetical protein
VTAAEPSQRTAQEASSFCGERSPRIFNFVGRRQNRNLSAGEGSRPPNHGPQPRWNRADAPADRGSAPGWGAFRRKLGPDAFSAEPLGKKAHQRASYWLGWPRCQAGGRFQEIRKTLVISIGTGGGSGIRTHDTVSRIHAFQACALSHSAIPPERLQCAQYSPARARNKLARRFAQTLASLQKSRVN